MYTVCLCGEPITQHLVDEETGGALPMLGRMSRCYRCAASMHYQRELAAWLEERRRISRGWGR